MNITNQGNKALIKNVVLNSVFRATESKDLLISVFYLAERRLNVKFDRIGAVTIGQNVVQGTLKRIDRMYVIYQCDDNSA